MIYELGESKVHATARECSSGQSAAVGEYKPVSSFVRKLAVSSSNAERKIAISSTFFSERLVNVWNYLPHGIVNFSSL